MNSTKKQKSCNRHFANFDIAGFSYYEGCMVMKDLEIGSQLELVREEDNKFDPYAIALYFGEHKLGFVPRSENHQLSKFVELGYGDLFDVRIQRISPDLHPENQIGVIVFLKDKK